MHFLNRKCLYFDSMSSKTHVAYDVTKSQWVNTSDHKILVLFWFSPTLRKQQIWSRARNIKNIISSIYHFLNETKIVCQDQHDFQNNFSKTLFWWYRPKFLILIRTNKFFSQANGPLTPGIQYKKILSIKILTQYSSIPTHQKQNKQKNPTNHCSS